ncbi:helix-turn-helix domain-containing protein [Streptomyces sp. NPDC008343]|uniref:helix-turn-helix domain-containing protein n=1 Tax=Streptomyces sp. NPDC008343 TaxID=3364828 RepID=UPI0036E09077
MRDNGTPGRAAGNALEIGQRLRSAREHRGLTIGQVAEFTGLTKGFISQVERDKTSASVASLLAICDALNLQISTLFEPPRTYINRASDRQPTRLIGEGVTDFVLSPPTDGRFQVIETRLEPGGGGDQRPYKLPVDSEFVVVLEGSLHVTIENQRFDLHEGDSLTFSARDRHSWRNGSDEVPARVMWVLTRGDGF